MFSLKETPLGNKHPYIEAIRASMNRLSNFVLILILFFLLVNFSYVNSSSLSVNLTTDVLVEVIFSHHTQLPKIGKLQRNVCGVWYSRIATHCYLQEWVICCDEGPLKDGLCTHRNRIILQNEFGNFSITDPTVLYLLLLADTLSFFS